MSLRLSETRFPSSNGLIVNFLKTLSSSQRIRFSSRSPEPTFSNMIGVNSHLTLASFISDLSTKAAPSSASAIALKNQIACPSSSSQFLFGAVGKETVIHSIALSEKFTGRKSQHDALPMSCYSRAVDIIHQEKPRKLYVPRKMVLGDI